MPAGGYGLFACRADRPAAAVNAAGFGDGLDLDGRAVHLFLRFQLDLIRADSIGKIKTGPVPPSWRSIPAQQVPAQVPPH